jgi:bile acid-coenzyme A ligase
VVIAAGVAIVSGQLPLHAGALIATGKLGDTVDDATGIRAARACFINILAQLDAELIDGLASVARVVRLGGFIAATPMLQRLAQVPGIGARDLSSLDWVQQGAAPLPVWLGRFWIHLIGAERFYLSYGASENAGLVVCRGDQWLERPGTLGRGFGETEVRIIGSDGQTLPSGEIGGIFLRKPEGPAAMYLGDDVPPMESTSDGFVTVGDMGWLDGDGYLFMADRRVDMIVTGGANVFPAEVEEALRSWLPELARVRFDPHH